MIRTQISMTEAQAEALRFEAARRGVSQSSLLREALDLLFADDELQRRIATARSVIGRSGSGMSETAEHHDEVLDEAYST